MLQKGKTKVINAGHGSAISLTEIDGVSSATILIQQKIYSQSFPRLLIETRTAELVESIDQIISLDIQIGDELSGNIYIIQQTEPFVESYPELYITQKEDNDILRTTKGEPIWSFPFYSERKDVKDQLITSYQR